MNNPYIKSLSYLIRHKWFVFLAGLKSGAPIWRLVIHDWSKLLPSEFFPYTNYFYKQAGSEIHRIRGGHYDPSMGPVEFNVAWLKHQHRNPHHWQYWLLKEDSGNLIPMEIPEHFVREMVADWVGAGMAQKNGAGIKRWYNNNRDKMILHPNTRNLVEHILFYKFNVPCKLHGTVEDKNV